MSELYTAQRLDNGEWVTGNYIHQYHSHKKGRRINAIVVSNELKSSRYEILDETLKQIDGKVINDLKRQLKEARELLSDIHQSIEHLSMSSDNGYTLGWCDEILVGIEKRLKEQG